jgi:uncharacterized protein (DUF2252 family)
VAFSTSGGAVTQNESLVPSPDAAVHRGRAVRYATPRSALATVAPRPTGFDPVSVLEATSADREVDLIPIRYARMRADAFSFFRGSAALQADDLARGSSTTIEAQLCGDAHLANFGVFASPERRLVFDVNDFDETARGPFEWDVKRLATSAVLAARSNGFSDSAQERAGRVAADAYRTAITEFSRQSTLAIWYATLDLDNVFGELRRFFTDEHSSLVRDVLATTPRASDTRAFAKLITTVDGRPRLASAPPLLTPLDDLFDAEGRASLQALLRRVITEYAQSLTIERRTLLGRFTPVDAARKVVGVGSVGTRCYAVLLLGRDRRDPFLLQVKEAAVSALDAARGTHNSLKHGERVVAGQRLMQATPDPFLGWHELEFPGEGSRSFYVRQMYDRRASVDLTRLPAASMRAYTAACAWTLARAHARSGSAVEIASYIGTAHRFDDAIASYALTYADQSERDYAALIAAIDSGRVIAAP